MKSAPFRLVALALSLGAVLGLSACNKGGAADASTVKAGLSDQGFALGDPKAKVTVIEFASLTCPHCAHWEETVWPAFKAKYVDTGKVHYIFKETLIHPVEDAAGSQLTHCVSPDKYFATVQAIFRSQPQMFGTPGQPGDVRGALLAVAKAQGMSEAQFNTCLQNDSALKAIGERQQKIEDTYKINSTPTFIVNGKVYDSGDMPIDKMSAAVDPLLK